MSAPRGRKHAGIIRWLTDRARRETRAAEAAQTAEAMRAHAVLAKQIDQAIADLRRAQENEDD